MKKLTDMITDFAYKTGKDTKAVLDDLLTYIIGYFNPEPKPDPQWKYTKEQNECFYNMMSEYADLMARELKRQEWFDAWGDLFMALTPKGGARGQFFTPANLCNMMAQSTVDTSVAPTRSCGAFGKRVVVNDPAAGSSRNLLAAHARFIHDNANKPYLVAEDIDLMCCKMSAVNMMMHGCYGEVICHDTLCDPKGVRVGYIINEGLYPLPSGIPTIRIRHTPEWFVLLSKNVPPIFADWRHYNFHQ